MKRGFNVLFLLILLVSPLILAAENNTQTTGNNETVDVFQGKAGIPSFTFLFTKFPGFYLEFTWVEFAIYVMASAFIFIATLEILSFTAFESGWVKALIAGSLLVITIITGALSKLANVFYNFQDNFKIIAWAVAILIVVLLVLKPIISAMKNRGKLSKAEALGRTAGTTLKGMKDLSEAAAKAGAI